MAIRSNKGACFACAVYDFLACIACAALVSLGFTQPAFAYVDPSVMTYTVQALAGVAVALSAVAGVAFRRGRKALMRTLNIDENARKEKEGPVHRLNGAGQPILTEAEQVATQPKPTRAEKVAKLSWPSRLWRSCLASILIVGTIMLVAPAELVASGASSLAFTLGDVWRPLLTNACIAAAVLALAMSLFQGKAFDFVFTIAVALSLCLYLQVMVFNQTLGAADGSAFHLENHLEITVVSTIVFAALLIGAVVLFVKARPASRLVGTFACVALIVIQGAGVASLWVNPANMAATPLVTSNKTASAIGDAVITKEGIYEVSPSHNVVVFALDTFDVVDLDDLLRTDPDILDEMTGFTYFSNSTGFCAPTRYGVPFLLTGIWPKTTETWDEFLTRRYPASTLTDDIVKQGYSLYVYTDTPGRGGMEHLAKLATNIHAVNENRALTNSSFNMDGALRMVYQMALYRGMPWLLKEPFWFYTDQVNQAAYDVEVFEEEAEVSDRVGGTTPYIMDDAAFFKQLSNRHLKVYDDGAKGSVHFIHLVGLHTPYTIDEHALRSDEETTRYQQAKGSLLIVDEYLRQMKELGVYDDATIIITADHGMWPWEDTIEQSESDGDMAGGPIMLVKRPGAADQSSQPCQVSEARTGFLDYPATLIEAVGGDTARYGTTVFEANDPERVRTYLWPVHNGTIDFTIYEYAIDGEVSDWSAWRRTGNEWPFNSPATNAL